MLKRKIYNRLVEWKHQANKRPLMIKGARQVGKTYIIKEFAKQNYKSLIEINFDRDPELKDIFAGNLSAKNIISQISLHIIGSEIIEGQTLLFLDEIQNCPNARTALKFLAEQKIVDVIASGSLLGVHIKEVPSIPSGYVESFNMYSLDFEEFLWAMGIKEDAIALVKEFYQKIEPVPSATHNKMMELFKQYIVVGGMPRVVNTFIEDLDYQKAFLVQKDQIKDYYDDIAKYAIGTDKMKAKECFSSIPRQLAKDYKKFMYSDVQPKGNRRMLGGALGWLLDAGIVSFCYNLKTLDKPLYSYAIQEQFKVYMNDTGLLIAMLDPSSAKDILEGNLGTYKGAIFENIIAEILTKAGHDLYYYAKGNNLEIDFITRLEGDVVAVEVKSADNSKSKSLNSVLKQSPTIKGIKLSMKNIGKTPNGLSIPLYMAMFLFEQKT